MQQFGACWQTFCLRVDRLVKHSMLGSRVGRQWFITSTRVLFMQPNNDAVREVVQRISSTPLQDIASVLRGFKWTFDKVSREASFGHFVFLNAVIQLRMGSHSNGCMRRGTSITGYQYWTTSTPF